MAEFPLPIKGIYYGFPVDKPPQSTSGYMNNVRAIDVLEGRVRLGQRPPLDKVYSEQIAGIAGPIVETFSITVAD